MGCDYFQDSLIFLLIEYFSYYLIWQIDILFRISIKDGPNSLVAYPSRCDTAIGSSEIPFQKEFHFWINIKVTATYRIDPTTIAYSLLELISNFSCSKRWICFILGVSFLNLRRIDEKIWVREVNEKLRCGPFRKLI